MKKYFGSSKTAIMAIAAPSLVVFPLIIAVISLCMEINLENVIVAIGCGACVLIAASFMKKVFRELYSWGIFRENEVEIKTGLKTVKTLEYAKCKSIGIGTYVATKEGTEREYIFMSYDVFNESYRRKINKWKVTPTSVKFEYTRKMYDYMLSVLPKNQARMLEYEHERMIDSPAINYPRTPAKQKKRR